jgi:hypothetical protein
MMALLRGWRKKVNEWITNGYIDLEKNANIESVTKA